MNRSCHASNAFLIVHARSSVSISACFTLRGSDRAAGSALSDPDPVQKPVSLDTCSHGIPDLD